MGSVFVTENDRAIKGFLGKKVNVPFYLQFVPGYTVDVVHSEESFEYGGKKTINTIIALPHYSDKVYKTRATTGEKNRYYPLLRNHGDIPSKGDPVLLCTIGKTNYYLGPLNTTENSPTWNNDPSFRKEVLTEKKLGVSQQNLNERGLAGESFNFDKRIFYPRLTKRHKPKLDLDNSVFEVSGDTVFEGRHGNSIRIGSRSNKPYIFLSNQRASENDVESLGDGSIISITSNGTLADHFETYVIDTGQRFVDVNGFTLASDLVLQDETPPNKFMGDLVSSVNNNQDTNDLIYNYGINDNENQILFHSDRITLNSKLDDIYLSSNKDIHIGTKRHFTISTAENMIIESSALNIGNPFREGVQMESMVLGEKLKLVLNEIVNMFNKIKIMTQTGAQGIQSDPAYTATTSKDLDNIVNLIDEITSTKHKIEQG